MAMEILDCQVLASKIEKNSRKKLLKTEKEQQKNESKSI